MKIETKNWKWFKISSLFNVKAGKYHYSTEYTIGTTPYISASSNNNGISEYISLPPDFSGNCIVTGKVGCTAFYQKCDFCATSDVNILYPKFTLNHYIGLFIVTIINKSENYKWNYGRQCRVGDTNEIQIKLPITKKGNPNWQFMEDYIKGLHHKQITTSIQQVKTNFDNTKWKAFMFGELIDDKNIYKAKAYTKEEVVLAFNSKTSIPFISRTENNNGCDCFVESQDEYKFEEGNAIIIGDTTATIHYQPTKFITGDHIIICRASWMNKYTALFIKTIINKNKYRYNYGRAFKMDLVKKTKLILPITKEGKPDWEYMENYIKSLPYSDRI